jgi:hypothetical protein
MPNLWLRTAVRFDSFLANRATIGPLVERLGRWPTDGKAQLYRAASLNGGVARWQKQLGLPPPRPRAGN